MLDIREENKRIVLKFFEHLTAGRMDDVVSLFAADGLFWGTPMRSDISMTEFSASLYWVKARLDGNMEMKLGPMTAEDNRVSVLAESFATMIDGKPYNNVYNFYFEIENGKITLGREYGDSAHLLQTLFTVDAPKI